MRGTALVTTAFLVLLLCPFAQAEGFIVPFGGVVFGGDAARSRANLGLGAGLMSDGLIGFEIDVAYSLRFFGDAAQAGENNLTSVMANVLVSGPLRGVRPYAAGGVGWLRARVDGPGGLFNLERNDAGMNVAVGVMGFFGKRVGVRGDLRYFRNIGEERDDRFGFTLGSTDFWRATAGVAIRFGAPVP